MNLQWLAPVVLTFASVLPIQAQSQPQNEVDSVLQGASISLKNYEELAPGINCDEATDQALRDSCKVAVETLGSDIQEADAKIAHYRQLSKPQVVDLFDIYEVFHKIMDDVEALAAHNSFYGEHNRQLFAQVYNNFVKLTGWFGNVMREAIRATPKCA